MSAYPDYVHKTLACAREEGRWQAGQANAAALCFDVLALFPDCEEAKELVYELFCDEWTIYDNRVAIQQNIDEWDDRPWQQRRRQALSYHFMSQWDGKYELKTDRGGPKDVRKILEDGKMERWNCSAHIVWAMKNVPIMRGLFLRMQSTKPKTCVRRCVGLAGNMPTWDSSPMPPKRWASMEFLLLGWIAQLTMGVAFWILPRFRSGPPRGNIDLVWSAFVILNMGIVMVAVQPFISMAWLTQTGRVLETISVLLFVLASWQRVKPLEV